jgi:hypothetical protein
MHHYDVARRDRSRGCRQARSRGQRSGSAGNQRGRKSTSIHDHDTVSIIGRVLGTAKFKSAASAVLDRPGLQHLVVPSGLPDMLDLLLRRSSMDGRYGTKNWKWVIEWESDIWHFQ